jgi:methylene-tetrahydromethanopterin dehydrogenase
MAEKHILHMLSPLPHVSPFDVNMALDAGFDAVLPYSGVTPEQVAGLVQDAIFSRSPKLGARTGMFIGGKDALEALDMLEAARRAMVPPFALSLFADPAGSFTTAAAMLARVERTLRQEHRRDLKGLKVAVFGATGVVGFSAAVIAALAGAEVTLAGYDGTARVRRSAAEIERRFGVKVDAADASTDALKAALLQAAEVALSAGRAGVQVLSGQLLGHAPRLLVVADVNAVPPAGIEGLDPMADGVRLGAGEALGVGALAIGQTKYRTEFGLFRRMIEAGKPVAFDFRDAFALARELAG